MAKKRIAVLGATGLVGSEVIRILEQRNFPVDELRLFASERSEGQKILFRDEMVDVLASFEDFIDNVEIVFSCLDENLAAEIVPRFRAKSVVIDNSSAFRMNEDVPLVIPEINPEEAAKHKGIIANPNCSTIQMLVPLWPLHRKARVKRIFVATYQSVSGYGRDAIDELSYDLEWLAWDEAGQSGEKIERVFPRPIGGNVIPQIGGFNEQGLTKEEMKMINETRKIFKDPEIVVSPTCVRVPVFIGHSEALSVEFEKPIGRAEAKSILKHTRGVVMLDKDEDYPVPIDVAGKDEIFVGRLREDPSLNNALRMWIVADNVRKGAALNAVQIAELL